MGEYNPEEVEITSEMIDAGVEVVLSFVGGADVGGYFSPEDLAVAVYLAMRENFRQTE